jgi:hypothetical protein
VKKTAENVIKDRRGRGAGRAEVTLADPCKEGAENVVKGKRGRRAALS